MTVTEMLAEKTIIVDTQVAALKREREENKRLTERIADIKDDKFTYCAYCGEEFPIDVGGDVIDDHIKTCEKHPIAVYKAENQRLTDRVEFLQAQSDELAGHLDNARSTQLQLMEENKRLRDALWEYGVHAPDCGSTSIVGKVIDTRLCTCGLSAALAEQTAATSAQVETVCRCPLPLRAILDWWMCSDPWPGGDHDAVETWLTCLCSERGYDGWAVAYHEVVEPSEEETDGK